MILPLYCLEVHRRILLELAKLGDEVRQMRNLLEKQSVGLQYSSTDAVIPELSEGSLTTLDGYEQLQKRCKDPKMQTSLVSA